MSDLAELEHRIRQALERIDAGIERLPPPGAPAAAQAEEIARLQEMLDAERAARAAAESELAALHASLSGPAAEGAEELDRLMRQIDAQSLDTQRLRASVAALREEVRRLTEAMAEGLADPALINHALAAEVESLRAQRASETVEMTDILAELDRLVQAEEERAHA